MPPAAAIPAELARYHRQIILPGIGIDGQRRLAASRAVLVGCGALGTAVADALARAGIGHLTIIDRDLVEYTNLQRQVLYDETDARGGVGAGGGGAGGGLPKAEAASVRLARVNSSITIVPVVADLNARNIESLCDKSQVIIDGTDNFQTRYLLNDVCVKHNLPLIYGGVVGTAGMTMSIVPPTTPCLRCVFPDPPPPGSAPTCDTAGVLGPMAGVVACIQAAEAIKVLIGRADLLRPTLTEFDIWNNLRRSINLTSIDRSHCPCCGQRRFEFLEAPVTDSAALCGTDSVQVLPPSPVTINLTDFAVRMRRAGHADFAASRFMARGTIESLGLTVFADGRIIVKGTTDVARAKSVYARYVGA